MVLRPVPLNALILNQNQRVNTTADVGLDPAAIARLKAGVDALQHLLFTFNVDQPAPPRARSKGHVREEVLVKFGLEVREDPLSFPLMRLKANVRSFP
jgi:hypothetical protein